ncbi:hypothetical protein Pla110_22270 [Polystyrenella longa]|uniref:Alpha/beta hydrolase family protein n=1 Tax=Polystyrenella longa TaxID=2528007 RepID=A0A518CMP5_9PLAN|nr:CPXCG motif-containing cysteine-rich protein [Polystyrenella longa]QDU80497.1 hypothetical protein Pla110_22270 [Polystyrenella longa]
MKILFLHEEKNDNVDVISTCLIAAGHEVLRRPLNDADVDLAINIAQQDYDRYRPNVVIGQHFGGTIAMELDSGETPLTLLYPDWKKWGLNTKLKSNSVILHSRFDDVVPFTDSKELFANSGLPPETLIAVGNDHSLTDEESLSVLLWACDLLVSGEEMISLHETSQNDASYVCDSCGETIIIPLDVTEGVNQTYVEDCPVCCHPNTIHVLLSNDGSAQVWSEPEQDHD